MKNVVLIGATGFVGSAILNELLNRGHKVTAVVRNTSSNHTPTYSNTKNTTYFAYSKERHRIEAIYYYRNHRLVKSVDFGKGREKPHVHYWSPSGMVGRKRHDKKNSFELSARDKRLMALAKTFKI